MRTTGWRRAIGLLFRALYLVPALVFLVGYASAYLPPSWFWWTGLLATLVPYAALLLLVLSPVVLWRFGWRGRSLHGVLLVLLAVRFAPWSGFLPAPSPGADDLVVMTFNAPVRGPDPELLAAETVALVRAERPDVLALQEPVVWLTREVPPVRRATPHLQALIDSLGYDAPLPQRSGQVYDIEQPVVARFPVEERRQVVLPAGGGGRGPTYVSRVRFRWQGREAVLYNVHLHTVGEKKPWQDDDFRLFNPANWWPYLRWYRAAYRRRAWEAREVRRMVERETMPVLVVGDFNSTVHHWEYRELARGLHNAFTQRGRTWGATYHARLPLVRIDHILAGPEWEVVSAHVPSAHAFSDHRAVVARLRWRTDTPPNAIPPNAEPPIAVP